MTLAETIGALFLLASALILWLLPVILAATRKHPQTMPITIITLLAGWTLVGWIIALAWSVAKIEAPRPTS